MINKFVGMMKFREIDEMSFIYISVIFGRLFVCNFKGLPHSNYLLNVLSLQNVIHVIHQISPRRWSSGLERWERLGV